jgi:hypothetical protein
VSIRRRWLLALPVLGAAAVAGGFALSWPVLAATASPTPAASSSPSSSDSGSSSGSTTSPSPGQSGGQSGAPSSNQNCPHR